jgi:hypothetical protein
MNVWGVRKKSNARGHYVELLVVVLRATSVCNYKRTRGDNGSLIHP